eukprot:6863203-Pyramimonas_sp.AAC.1
MPIERLSAPSSPEPCTTRPRASAHARRSAASAASTGDLAAWFPCVRRRSDGAGAETEAAQEGPPCQ